MPHPDDYRLSNSFDTDARNGNPVDGSKVGAEFARVSKAVSSIIWFLKQFTLASGKVNSQQTLATNDMIDEIEHTVTVDIEAVFAAAQAYSTTDDYIRVWINDEFIPVADYTHDGEEITLTAPTTVVGDVVRIRTYLGLQTALDATATYLAAETGAGAVGVLDTEGQFAGTTVETVLAEIGASIADLLEEFGARTDYVLTDGTQALTGNWNVNERTAVIAPAAPATGAFDFTAQCADGDTITISDGANSVTFQFTNAAGSLVGSNVQVTLGSGAYDQALKFEAVFNAQPLAISLTATDNTTFASITLIHDVPGAIGNQDMSEDSASIANLTGMSGGSNAGTVGQLASQFRIRALPRAIQEGDPVVLEQLQEIQANLANLGIDFFRTDGTSVMDGDADFGNNRALRVGDATEATDGTNLGQVNDLLDALETELRDYVDTQTGSIGVSAYLHRTVGTDGMGRTLPLGNNPIENASYINLNNAPTQVYHGTRKDYVDGVAAAVQANVDAEAGARAAADAVHDAAIAALQSIGTVVANSGSSGASVTVGTTGTWIAQAFAVYDNSGANLYNSHCVVVNGAITYQRGVLEHDTSINTVDFSIAAGVLTHLSGATGRQSSVIAWRIA